MALEDAVAMNRSHSLALGVVEAIDRAVLALGRTVGIAVTGLLFMAICAAVVIRYLTDQGFPVINELPDLLFPWMVATGIVISAQYGRHIVVEFGVAAMAKRFARWVLAGVHAAAGLLFSFLAWHGTTVLEVTSGEIFPTLRIPTVWAYSALEAAFLALAVTGFTTAARILLVGGDPLRAREIQLPGEERMPEVAL